MLLRTIFCWLMLMEGAISQKEAAFQQTETAVQEQPILKEEPLSEVSLSQQEQLSIAKSVETTLMTERRLEETFRVIDEAVSKPGSSIAQHRQFTFTSRQSVDRGRDHRRVVLEVKEAFERKGVPVDRRKPLLDAGFGPQVFCNDNCTCDINTPYRTADGSCNNLKKTTWGMASIPMRRWLDPAYGDGIASPRTKDSSGVTDLPSARKVSVEVHKHSSLSDQHNQYTYMLMQWGQYLDHDITSTPQQQKPQGPYGTSAISCCHSKVSTISQNVLNNRFQCFPITIPAGDHHFNTTCMNFIRSVQVENADCKAAPAEQLNAITAYVDASNVYGSSQEEQNELRTFQNGLLKISSPDKLPKDPTAGCKTSSAPNYCFKAGDHRVNENPTLQSMHTIFMREHNRIAKELKILNCHWDDEKLFQEARKIVGAIHQKITYGEYLPIILGSSTMATYGLKIGTSGFTNVYNINTDASIRNAFATAAFRMGHSMIRDHLTSRKTDYTLQGLPNDVLSDVFGNTAKILSDPNREVGPYCRGLAFDKVQKVDGKLSNQVTDHLFKDGTHSFDLAALNIQRGRDHGLPSYVEWRKVCNVPGAINTFNDLLLSGTHDATSVTQLDNAYVSVHDVDLFPGALSEKPVPGGLVGPTFACLLARQFKALKEGDRFWFEENNDKVHFKPSQLAELRKATLSRVICDNTDTTKIQKNAFVKTTAYVFCSQSLLPKLNLAPWKETIGSWSKWSDWKCYKDGIMRRSRQCLPCNCGCEGPNEQSMPCSLAPPCKWSPWGPCNWKTGIRQRACQNYDGSTEKCLIIADPPPVELAPEEQFNTRT